MNDVVYISWMPLSERVERDWYISYLQSNGLHVQYWDLSAVFFEHGQFGPSLKREYVVFVQCLHDLAPLIAKQDLSRTKFVMLFAYETRFYRLFRMLTRYNCRLYFFEWGNFPIKPRRRPGDIFRKIANPAKVAFVLTRRVLKALSEKLDLVKPFDVVFAGGYASMSMQAKAGRQVPVNFFDYDTFLATRGAKKLVPGRYCVFLDINLPYHSDLKVVGLPPVDPEAYLTSLERFFRMVEERFAVEVVVAAHPKANYTETIFGGRTVIKGATPDLVKDAVFVISHHSSSISYAILNRKPILFVYTAEMAKVYSDTIVSWIGDFARYLHQPVVNVDEIAGPDDIEMLEPESEPYDSYKYNYLTTKESENTPTREIFLAEMLS